MLTFVGLGLYDEHSVTLAGQDAIQRADRVVAEFYTSRLVGTTIDRLEAEHDTSIEVRDRSSVEQTPDDILDDAEEKDVVFCTGGDPMISTTHVDLRLRARERDIPTRIVHGVTAQTAASSLTGLQNYRFGPATTLPFPDGHGADGLPTSVTATLEANRERGLHTIVYLDIDATEERFMTADVAASLLAERYPDLVGVVVGQAGSPEPTVVGGQMPELSDVSAGEPLHLLVVPGTVHLLEADALAAFAGVNRDTLDLQ
ncbi:MAG: diphthine synthase [Natrialbaceae archaeon]|nr:diphthine synthase [Natrialbaceae archaeon]